MVRKFLAFLLLTFTLLAPEAKALSPIVEPPTKVPPTSFFGQRHDYSVTLRGNGESVVSARVAFTNSAASAISSMEMRLPLNVQTSEVIAFQVIREAPCVQYDYSKAPQEIQPPCLQYGEIDYYEPYWAGTNLYQRADASLSGDTLTVKLPKSIEKDKSGSFFVYFRATGYTSRDLFGSINFNFESLRVNESIQSLNVGISTDSDLYLKGAKGTVDYRFDTAATSSLKQEGLSAEPSRSSAIDTFYNQIGYGVITKTASNLAPLESYEVEGAYADSKLKLYGKEIAVGIVAFLVVIIFILVVLRLIMRRRRLQGSTSETPKAASRLAASSEKPLAMVFGLSLGSAFLTALFSILLVVFMRSFERLGYYELGPFIYLVVLLVAFVVFVVLTFGPALFVGTKKGLGWGLGTLFMTVFWLVLLLVVIGVGFFLFGNAGEEIISPFQLQELQGASEPDRL